MKYKYYYLYQIINLINGKIYIGAHRTNNLGDDYMGSGKLIIKAQKKYGLENFKKEILKYFDNEKEMFNEEAVLVNKEFVLRKDTYNINIGGNGIFPPGAQLMGSKIGGKSTFENRKGYFSDDVKKRHRKYLISEEHLKKLLKASYKATLPKAINKKKETFKEIKHQQGSRNSQFGTMWITNGISNKKIKKEEEIPNAWVKGRVQKK